MVVRYQFNRQLLKKLNIHIPWAYHFHYWVTEKTVPPTLGVL